MEALKKPIRGSRVAKAAPLASKHRQDASATCHSERKKTGRVRKAGSILPVFA
jgi:hypothetical protein